MNRNREIKRKSQFRKTVRPVVMFWACGDSKALMCSAYRLVGSVAVFSLLSEPLSHSVETKKYGFLLSWISLHVTELCSYDTSGYLLEVSRKDFFLSDDKRSSKKNSFFLAFKCKFIIQGAAAAIL